MVLFTAPMDVKVPCKAPPAVADELAALVPSAVALTVGTRRALSARPNVGEPGGNDVASQNWHRVEHSASDSDNDNDLI